MIEDITFILHPEASSESGIAISVQSVDNDCYATGGITNTELMKGGAKEVLSKLAFMAADLEKKIKTKKAM
jgi:hypothetical protein